MRFPPGNRCGGFTLLELIAVIVIVSLAAVPISGLFGKAGLSLLYDQRIQSAIQLAQEQAELILGRRRNQGFAAVVPGIYPEKLAGNYAGFNRTTTIIQPAIPPSGCPVTALCTQVIVAVDAGTTSLSEITFVLVDY